MRESRPYGSVRGDRGNPVPYRDHIVQGGLRPDDLARSFHRIVRQRCRRVRVGPRSKTETPPHSGFRVIAFRRRRIGGSARCHANCFHQWVIILPADRIAKVAGLRPPPAGPRASDPATRRSDRRGSYAPAPTLQVAARNLSISSTAFAAQPAFPGGTSGRNLS